MPSNSPNVTSLYPDALVTALSDPAALRRMPRALLPALADEVRSRMINKVTQNGGHFAAGLGVVELTVALHRTLNTPWDRLVWDVGHQCYPHKILTDRCEELSTIRQQGGISGFPVRDESLYDSFGVAHAGTSISAALGMALAASYGGRPRNVCAVIGDGALTSGMAFEALNHAGGLSANLMVVLNDNSMSISENIGALNDDGNRSTDRYEKLFQALGFDYFLASDGHDVLKLVNEMAMLRRLDGPRVLHVRTQKGKGHAPAEADPVRFHAIGGRESSPPTAAQAPKSVTTATPQRACTEKLTFSQVFGSWLSDMAARDPELVAITPAMIEGSGMQSFAKAFPSRCIDAGICEQHAVTLAAGLACDGAKPVVAIYSSFLQRAFDQVIHDIALQKLPVLFAVDRAGVAGADGPTHHGFSDLSFLRTIPEMVVMCPSDEVECRNMLYSGYLHDGPAAVRYPRGKGPGAATTAELAEQMNLVPIGKGKLLRQGSKVAILAFGTMVDRALRVGNQLDATVVNMRFAKPIDAKMVQNVAATHDLIVTLEDNAIAGGAGSAVNETLAAQNIAVRTLNLGLPDAFVAHATQEQQLTACHLDVNGITTSILWQLDAQQVGTALSG